MRGTSCEECDCNNNIDPDDSESCDPLTGECLKCLHHTTGRRCEDCRSGYYGNALVHDCKECSCDRRGSEITLCPLQSPCFCDPVSGQCPCRAGVTGVLCDECEDGYWNIELGCQPCSCDSANAHSNVCDKVTGQCPCHPEYGGRQCDECGENHFGNPDLQCVSCDCNLDGTLRPLCDSETGECNCREGVTGIFCDKCAPGFAPEFPACEECHPCAHHWGQHVADVERATRTMRTFIPRPQNELRPGASQQLLRRLFLDVEHLRKNVTRPETSSVSKMEKQFQKILKLKDSIDPNLIHIDPTPVLNSEIEHTQLQFMKLLENLRHKVDSPDDEYDEDAEDLLEDIKKSFKSFMSEEKRVKNAEQAIEESADTRQDIKHKLSTCGGQGVQGLLEKKVKALSITPFNKQICGGPGVDCSKCGGALCVTWLFSRKCGGPDCDGIMSLSQEAVNTAKKTQDNINALPLKLLEAKNMMDRTNQTAQETKEKAKDLEDRINSSKESFEKDKNKTKELIKRVKDYLLDELIPAEDIEKMAHAVLSMQLPKTPHQIRAMINDITSLLLNASTLHRDLRGLEEKAKTAQELQKKAQELKNRTKNINVSDITKDIYDAEKAQDKANDNLDKSSRNIDMINNTLQDMKDKLDDAETKLMEKQPEDLKNEIEAVKNKTEQNREMAEEAREAAESALNNAMDTIPDLQEVLEQFEILKQKKANQTEENEASKRLKDLTQEAEELKKEMENKLQQIEDLEKWIEELNKNGADKAAEVAELLKKAESLQNDISARVSWYLKCN